MRYLPLILLPLAGCAHVQPQQPAVQVQIQKQYVPVATPCAKKADIPGEPANTGPLPFDARQAADLLGAKVIELRQWGHKLVAKLDACSE